MITFFSPAKINLFLKVLSREKNGYHSLASLFHTVDLGDIISFRISDSDNLTCTKKDIPLDGKNLILQAVDLFRKKTGKKLSLAIHLEKNIPDKAGLGGGSSNAATTLWALNQITGAKISIEELKKWGLEIGSDVPFFFSRGMAFCTGRGEEVLEIDHAFDKEIMIAKPNEGLSTSQVFNRLDLDNLLLDDPKKSLEDFVSGNCCYYNDLEKPAFSLLPKLKNIKDDLISSGFQHVTMTGSGSAFFCVGSATSPKIKGVDFYKTKTITRSSGQWY